MKNLMSRNEYLQSTNEGFKDTLRKGWEKIKSVFAFGMKKVKDFIAIFDSKGNVFPVVSPQAVIDKFSDSDSVRVYAPSVISDSVVEAGGNGCEQKAPLIESDEMYDNPLLSGEDYKDSIEYKNFLSIPSLLNEHFNLNLDLQEISEEKVNESWEAIVKNRIKYIDNGEFSDMKTIDYDEFEAKLNKLINQRLRFGNRTSMVINGKTIRPTRNIIVFGAPGIGKSTIPNMVISKYNNNDGVKGDPSQMMSLITINCANLEEGQFMMPTMPKDSEIMKSIDRFQKTFPQANEFIAGLDDEDREKIAATIDSSSQFKSTDAPKSWLPSYKETGDDRIDKLLDAVANGGVYANDEGFTCKTGGGGIILFDEFLRAKPGVFSELMTFFLTRRFDQWVLGSKWTIIACSNRPVDDAQVTKVWKDWIDSPAVIDRLLEMVQLKPDVEQWKKWIMTKGVDKLLIDFIFEPKSMDGDEYPRWHTNVRRGTGEGKLIQQVTPRRWEDAFYAVNEIEVENGYKDISEIPRAKLKDCLEYIFSSTFVEEILEYLEKHINKVDLDGIFNDPKSVYFPEKFKNDPEAALTLIENLYEQLEERYKKHPKDCSDDELANVIIWLGINYKGNLTEFQNFINKIEDNIWKDTAYGDKVSDTCLLNYTKTMMMIAAAFPVKNVETDLVQPMMEHPEEKVRWPEDSLEIIKGYMKEYFPWRLNGDEIKYYDDIEEEDEE